MRILSHNVKPAGGIGQVSGPCVFMVRGRRYRRNEIGEFQVRNVRLPNGVFSDCTIVKKILLFTLKKMTYEGGSVTAHEPHMPL
jgi:hypothetical protein